MSKTVIWALILIALSTLVLIFSRKTVEVNLIFTTIRATAALVYLAFIAVGVVIGILLK